MVVSQASKKLLFTGASGFIGRHCLKFLENTNYELHVIAHPGYNLFTFGNSVNIHNANLLDEKSIREIIKSIKPTDLLHLAWDVNPTTYLESPSNIAWLNSSLTLLECFLQEGGNNVVIAGTGAEYAADAQECIEDKTQLKPTTLYGWSKHSLHMLLTHLQKTYPFMMKWCRIFSLYGPHEHHLRFIPSLIKSLLTNTPYAIMTPDYIKDYLYVEDVASALVCALMHSSSGTYNISSGHGVSVEHIAQHIEKITERYGLITYNRNHNPLPSHTLIGNNKKLKTELSWNETTSLQEGLKKTIACWMQTHASMQDIHHANQIA